jgi:phosphatidylinositol glycan class V
MFAILIASGAWAIRYLPDQGSAQAGKIDREAEKELSRERTNVLRNMAISQLFLVLLTLTTAHVQIITRISSAYPVWLWYLSKSSGEGRLLGAFAKFMVLYCIIQGGLYASFLPPA